jgi:predicted nicotinamide N-methyase
VEVLIDSMDLDRLFITTDYSNVTVTIACNDDTCQNDLQVTLACSQAATTDYDLTGQLIWPVSVLLSHYLASSRGRQLVRKRNVVEMGAGCGLAGLVASHVGAHQVILTDGNEIVLDLLRQNCQSTVNVKTLKLIWGDRENLSNVLRDMTHVDVVIAADVVQWPAVVEPLLHSVKALLWSSECETPTLVLGIVNRAQSTYDMFFELAAKLGFSYRRVPHDNFLKVLPKSCQEYGGRVTEVWEVELVDRSQEPVLLQADNGENTSDPTLGSAYQNTSYLPC